MPFISIGVDAARSETGQISPVVKALAGLIIAGGAAFAAQTVSRARPDARIKRDLGIGGRITTKIPIETMKQIVFERR